jgi:ABC-type Fe3+ transport system permease subunit
MQEQETYQIPGTRRTLTVEVSDFDPAQEKKRRDLKKQLRQRRLKALGIESPGHAAARKKVRKLMKTQTRSPARIRFALVVFFLIVFFSLVGIGFAYFYDWGDTKDANGNDKRRNVPTAYIISYGVGILLIALGLFMIRDPSRRPLLKEEQEEVFEGIKADEFNADEKGNFIPKMIRNKEEGISFAMAGFVVFAVAFLFTGYDSQRGFEGARLAGMISLLGFSLSGIVLGSVVLSNNGYIVKVKKVI